MRFRTMLRKRRVGVGLPATNMAGYPFALKENFHRSGGESHLHLLAYQLVRRTVVMAVQLHVIVDIDSCLLPLGKDEALCRQRLQCWPIDGRVQLGTRTAQFSEGALVQLDEQLGDGFVEFREAEE